MKKSPSLLFELLANGGDERNVQAKLAELDLQNDITGVVVVHDTCGPVDRVLGSSVPPGEKMERHWFQQQCTICRITESREGGIA